MMSVGSGNTMRYHGGGVAAGYGWSYGMSYSRGSIRVSKSWGGIGMGKSWSGVRVGNSWGGIRMGESWGGVRMSNDWSGSYDRGGMDSWFPVDYGVETVVWVSGVFYGAFAAIRFEKGVATVDDISTSGFLLLFVVAGVGVAHSVSEVVVGWSGGFGVDYWGGMDYRGGVDDGSGMNYGSGMDNGGGVVLDGGVAGDSTVSSICGDWGDGSESQVTSTDYC